MSEVKEIMDLLGRKMLDGQIRGSHLGQILMYLERKQTESLKQTLAKLALICGMAKRQVKENYVEGIEAFGIIQTKVIGNDIIWRWIGKNAFDNSDESFMDYVKRKKEEELEKNKEKVVKDGKKKTKKETAKES